MEYRQAGKSGLDLSVIGAGCWSYGGGEYWGHQDQSDVDKVVARAVDLGINYFDTAESYNDGASEESLGRALKGLRGKVLIGTKVSPNHCYRDSLRASCEASLSRLGPVFKFQVQLVVSLFSCGEAALKCALSISR
ncbi:MAG: aldo/keto reductase, partial [Victivallales bacterium]|nr:aldo/keto reductase [Victivallales bacterium]